MEGARALEQILETICALSLEKALSGKLLHSVWFSEKKRPKHSQTKIKQKCLFPVLEHTVSASQLTLLQPSGVEALLGQPGGATSRVPAGLVLAMIYLQILLQNQDNSSLLSYILVLQSAECTGRHPWAFR